MPYLLSFMSLQQQGMGGMLPAAVLHPSSALLQSYVEEIIPVSIVPPWSREALDNDAKKGPHTSACTPEMVGFIRGEMQRRL